MPKCNDKPWERQNGESEKAFEAFSIYRDMNTNRSIRAVGETLGKSSALMERWSSRWDWVERVRAYDNELEKEAHAKALKDRKSMITRHTKIAMQLQKKALEALENLSTEAMSPKDIREYIKLSTDLERVSRTESIAENSAETSEEEKTTVDIYMPEKEEENE